MAKVHHAIVKKAEKLGITIEHNEETGEFLAKHTKTNFQLRGSSPSLTVDDLAALVEIKTSYTSFEVEELGDGWHINTQYGHFRGPNLRDAFNLARKDWEEHRANMSEAEEDEERAAEEQEAEEEAAGEEGEETSGDVVRQIYRARYAEAGHPTHCGDWLASTLNNLVGGKALNIDALDRLAQLNNVDLSKYSRTSLGWQGRLRMTFRNKLARAVFLNDGKLIGFDEEPIQAPGDWMAGQRFKK